MAPRVEPAQRVEPEVGIQLPGSGSLLAAYDDLVAASPQGVIFCHSWWLDAVAPDRYRILRVEKGGQLKAAWPLVFRDGPEGRSIVMPDLTQKLGILFQPSEAKYAERLSDEHQLIGQLLEQLPPGCALEQHFHENFTNWLPFYWEGFQQTTRYTYLIPDLSDIDAVWGELRTNARRVIRKAMKEGIRVRETDDLEYFYQVGIKTFERQGMEPTYSLELLARVDSAVARNAGRKILIAEDAAGRPHACEYLIYDARCAISLIRGADPELRSSGASGLLQWEAIRFASTVSRIFDFEGSMIQGVEMYLRDFGARQTPYFRIWRSGSEDRVLSRTERVRHFAARVLRKAAHLVGPS